jgi:hypothetical protein
MQSVVPDARFVYLVRDPVDRIWSQYLHNMAHGREARPLMTALCEDPQYLAISRYHEQLAQYLEVFAKERILVQVFEEMVADPAGTVRTVCSFLGVDTAYQPLAKEVAFNASGEKLAASRALRTIRSLGVHQRVPWRVRHWIKQSGSPLPSKRDGLTPDTRAHIVNALRPDIAAFFDRIGRRVRHWRDFA